MSSVVALPPHGLHIHINNEFRSPNEDALSFRAPFMPNNLDSGSYLLQLKQVITQNLFNNIEEGVSNVLMFSIDSVETTLYIDPGYYTIDTLLVAINTAITALGGGVLFSYDYDLRKVSVDIEPTTVFQFISPNIPKTQGTKYSSLDRLISMLGFWEVRNIVYEADLAGLVVRATNPVNLMNRLSMNIYLDRDLQVASSNYRNPQILCTVPIAVPFGEPIVYEPIQSRTFLLAAYEMESISVAVCDEYGNNIKAPENTTLQLSWTMLPQGKSFD